MIAIEQARMIHELRHVIHGEEFAGRVSDVDLYYLQRCEITIDRAGVDLTGNTIIEEPQRLRALWETWRIPTEDLRWQQGRPSTWP